jgi:6-phospho-beta-glucosidase
VKIAIIGGAGVRTPLLVNGLTESDLPIDDIALFDTDRARLRVIGALAADFAPVVRLHDDARSCVAGADFVLLSIRAGGIAARARDEAVAVAHGVAGQETVGPAGFAMAMRTIPHAIEYARLVEREAPSAWIVSFTNPVGIVSQAMMATTRARVVGICDTPSELFEDVAHALGVESTNCAFDYFGLNHLGWLREVYVDGEPSMGRIWNRPDLVERIYRAPLFEASFLERLRLLPTEYLYYYYCADRALANMRAAGRTRGQTIQELNDRLFADLAGAHDSTTTRRIYEDYIAARNAGYMQIESGAGQPIAASPWAALTGYDKIALSVLRAIHFDSHAVIPLNVLNRGTIGELAGDDVVEVPCLVGADGARPAGVIRVPPSACDLIVRVKAYERLTIAAAESRSTSDIERALAANPLVRDADQAARLTAALGPW